MKNVELLDFINSKKKKLNLSDFIDFYSSGKQYANGGRLPKTIFADGGTLPSQMNAPQMNVRNVNAQTYSDNRPIVVSVTEINDVQARVRNVQALAGLND